MRPHPHIVGTPLEVLGASYGVCTWWIPPLATCTWGSVRVWDVTVPPDHCDWGADDPPPWDPDVVDDVRTLAVVARRLEHGRS